MANIEHLQTVRTSAARVYEALTTAEGLAGIWTRELVIHNEVGGIHEFRFGSSDVTKMRVEELNVGHKVVWQCIDSDPEWVGTRISFELAERNEKCCARNQLS